MSATWPDAAEIMRLRLQADLRTAMKARLAREVSVLRSLIAAIDNAGAVPVPARSEPPQHEAPRRTLEPAEIQALLQSEHGARQAAAEAFSSLGLELQAGTAADEAAVVARYLAAPMRG